MTPQMQLTLSSIFDGKNIRATEINGEIWIPVVDLADAWEVDRTTLTKIINRNPELFKTLSTVIELPSSKEIAAVPQSVNNSLRLVNERGTVILALKVSAKDLKNPIAKDKVIEFQLWIPQLIQDLRKGIVQLTPAFQPMHTLHMQRPADILNEQLDAADVLVKRSGMPKEIAHAMAVTLAGEVSGMNLQPFASYIKAQTKQLLLSEAIPQDKADYDSYFTRKQLGEFLKLPDAKILNTLESLNVVYFEHGIWHLTKKGEKYGRVFMVTPGYPYRMTQKAWIKYNPECVELLKKYFEGEVKA